MTGPVELGVGLAAAGLVALAIGALQLRAPTFWLASAWGIPPTPEPGWPERAVQVVGGFFACVGLAAVAGGAFVASTVV